MTLPRSRPARHASKAESALSAKALPLAPAFELELAARFEVQRRELHQTTQALVDARARIARDQRLLTQLKARLEGAEERASSAEEEAAQLYVRAHEGEARLERAAAEREQALAEADERLLSNRADTAAEVATLRDALAAALERERVFRRVEADLRQRLAAASNQPGRNIWESPDAHASLRPEDSATEARGSVAGTAVDGSRLVP